MPAEIAPAAREESPAGRSAFEDEKLYASVEISPELAATEEDNQIPIIH